MKKELKYIILIGFISIILTFLNYFWIKQNLSHIPLSWDQAAYIYVSLNEYEIIKQGDAKQFVNTVTTQAPHIAPLFFITVIPFFMLFSPNIQSAFLVNGLYLFIMLVSVFFITKKIAGKYFAIFAVFLVSTFPAIIAYSRDFLLEFPLASLTSLSYLFFIKSDSFSARKDSIIFGVSAGLSILAKTMGIVFFVMPLFYGIYVFLRGSKENKKNVVYAYIAFFCIASFYYIPKFKYIFDYLFYYGIGEGSHHYDCGISNIFSLKYWTIYLESIMYRGIGIIYFLVFISSTIFILITKQKKLPREYWMLWLLLIFGYILLSIPRNKGLEQYALPILPLIAIIIAVNISKISYNIAKYIFVLLVLIIGSINYIYQTRVERCLYDQYFLKGIPLLIPEHSACKIQDSIFIENNKDWDITSILSFIDNLNTDKHKIIKVLVAFDHPFLNINNLRLYSFVSKLNKSISTDFSFERIADKQPNTFELLINESHFIVTKSGYQGPNFINRNNSIIRNLIGNKTPLKIFQMPDGSSISIYKGYLPL